MLPDTLRFAKACQYRASQTLGRSSLVGVGANGGQLPTLSNRFQSLSEITHPVI